MAAVFDLLLGAIIFMASPAKAQENVAIAQLSIGTITEGLQTDSPQLSLLSATVIPVKTGIHHGRMTPLWIPACVGMTGKEMF